MSADKPPSDSIEQAVAARIDRAIAFLAPERSIGEYLIAKGFIDIDQFRLASDDRDGD